MGSASWIRGSCVSFKRLQLCQTRERTGRIKLLRTIAPKVASFVLDPELRVVVPVYDVLYLLIGRLLQIPPA